MNVRWNLRWGLVLLMAGAGARQAGATNFVYTGASGDWNGTTLWTPNGIPAMAAGDTATFTNNLVRTARLTVTPPNALDAFNVGGLGTWTWNIYTTNSLNVGTGNLNFNSESTTTNTVVMPIAGAGKLIVNSGKVLVGNSTTGSFFTGGVEINGGLLLSGRWKNAGLTNDLGGAPIYLGATNGPAADAELRFSGRSTNAIFVRSGNAGRAVLGSHYIYQYQYRTLYLGGRIALEKDLLLVNDESGINNETPDSGILQLAAISGVGSIAKEGVGIVQMWGLNSYTGATTISGGFLEIYSVNNTFTGPITVEHGELRCLTNPVLGNAANTVTLGGPGTIGCLSARPDIQSSVVQFPRPVTLAGNGGLLTSYSSGRLYMNNTISGAGRLILAENSAINLKGQVNANNTYSGGTIGVSGWWDIDAGSVNNRVYGNGDIRMLNVSDIAIRGTNNVNPAATVSVFGSAGIEVYVDYLPKIGTNSNGRIWFGLTAGPFLTNRFADVSQPIGNGTIRLSAGYNANLTYNGFSLAALAGHDPAHTYRLGGSLGNGTVTLNTPGSTNGALKDLNGETFHVDVSGANAVYLWDDNPFSGNLAVRGTTLYGYTAGWGNPLGIDTGAVYLGSAGLQVQSGVNLTRSISKGILTYDGGCQINIDANAGTPTWTNTFNLGGLQREGRSTLGLSGIRGFLGTKEVLMVAGGMPSKNGMVAPYIWNSAGNTFVDYNPTTGFTNSTWDKTNLTGDGSTNRVLLAGATAVPAGGAAVYALRAGGSLTGGVLTNLSGGMILNVAGVSHFAPLDFGTNEAVLLVTAETALSNTVTCSGGLTKSGAGILNLRGNNVGTLTGGIVVEQGTLTWTNWANLGGPANVITLNGGTLSGVGGQTITNDIYVGPRGGSLTVGGLYKGNISGPGSLSIYWYANRVMGTNNTYSGGTWIGQSNIDLPADSSMGSGPIWLANGGSTWGGSGPRHVTFYGDKNTTTNQDLVVMGYSDSFRFNGTNHVIGSLSGYGFVDLGRGGNAVGTTLRLGGKNTDTEFFGVIEDGVAYTYGEPRTKGGWLVKEGTGTFTLWAEGFYSGGTIVSNGTLVVNNWLNPAGPVTVRPGATLDGSGSVGTVNNLGGTVKGSLYIRRLTMDAASALDVAIGGTNAVTDYGQLHVSESVNLAGSTLNLTLGFGPAPGQEFTILSGAATASVTGTFSTGQKVSASFGGKTYWFAVNYAGGTSGKDIVLKAIPTGTVFTIR